MTDHADTIRRDAALKALMELDGIDRVQAVAEDPSLLDYVAEVVAERQQAIDERDAYKKQWNDAVDELSCDIADLRARCEQAIDALRTLAYPKGWPEDERGLTPGQQCLQPVVEFARAALLSLGEQPQPKGYTRKDARKDTMRP